MTQPLTLTHTVIHEGNSILWFQFNLELTINHLFSPDIRNCLCAEGGCTHWAHRRREWVQAAAGGAKPPACAAQTVPGSTGILSSWLLLFLTGSSIKQADNVALNHSSPESIAVAHEMWINSCCHPSLGKASGSWLLVLHSVGQGDSQIQAEAWGQTSGGWLGLPCSSQEASPIMNLVQSEKSKSSPARCEVSSLEGFTSFCPLINS